MPERLKRLGVPAIILVGGTTGTGKSTVATELAHRLGITPVSYTHLTLPTIYSV